MEIDNFAENEKDVRRKASEGYRVKRIALAAIAGAIVILAVIFYWPQNYGKLIKDSHYLYASASYMEFSKDGVRLGDVSKMIEPTGEQLEQMKDILSHYHYHRSLNGIFKALSFMRDVSNVTQGTVWNVMICEDGNIEYIISVGQKSGAYDDHFNYRANNEKMMEEIFAVLGEESIVDTTGQSYQLNHRPHY